jgi:ABC-type transport system substrate-binding protein
LAREDVEKGMYTGCGAYMQKEAGENKYELKAFDAYFGGRPYVDTIEVFYKDGDIAQNFLDGRYDFVVFSNNNGIEKILNSQYKHNLKTQDVMTTSFAGFNLRANSIFARNKEVRKALNYAVNKKKIVDEIESGLAREAKGVLPPSIIDDTSLLGFSYNPEKAKQILKKEGFYNSPKKLTVLGWQNNSQIKTNNQRVIDYLIEDFKAVGVECDIVRVPSEGYLSSENVSKCDIYIMGWIADTGDADNYLEPLFYPDNYTNFCGYDNSEVTKLMDEAKKTVNPEKRVNMYKNIQSLIVEDAPWIFLYHPETTYISREGIDNIKLNPLGKLRFEDIIVND